MEKVEELKLPEDNVKKCSKCGCFINLSLFGKDKVRKNGMSSWCIECVKKYQKEYHKLKRDSLSDGYIKIQLSNQGFPEECITAELIEEKRAHIQLKRAKKMDLLKAKEGDALRCGKLVVN